MDKKNIVIIVLVIVLVGCLVYFFAFNHQSQPEKNTIGENIQEKTDSIDKISDKGLFDSKPAQKKEESSKVSTDKLVKEPVADDIIKLEDEIVGLWHISPHVAAGYADRYYFFPDKTFRFAANSMDGENRNVGYKETWIIKNGNLILTITKEQVLEGGYLEQSPSSITGSEIVDGEIVEKDVNPVKTMEFKINMKPDSEGFITILNDKVRYYKLSPDPDI